MKKIKRLIAALMLACAFLFGSAPVVQVRADEQTSGPQGQKDSKSKGPSTESSSVDFYLLWLIIFWLLGLL